MLKTNLNDVNFSLEQFLLELNNLLKIHAPFKYSKRKNEKHNKPWITNGIANSIRKKNNLYKKLCRAKDPERKEELHKLYKAYKNTYKMWQEIKVLINTKINKNINTQTKYAPICLQIKDSVVIDSKVIENECNNLFKSIASNIDSKTIQAKTNFLDNIKITSSS